MLEKVVGFDLDGVIVDYVGAVRKGKPSIISEGPFTYSMVEDGWFDSKDEWLKVHSKMMESCEHFDLLDPSIVEAVAVLHQGGFVCKGITARSSKYAEGTLRQLSSHGVEFDEVIFTDHKALKSSFGMAYIFEDHPDTVLEKSETVMALRDHPYNQHVPDHIPRFESCIDFALWVVSQ